MKSDMIKIKQIKSVNGRTKKIRETLKGLGLRRIGHEAVLINTPPVRGMIKKVIDLVKVL
jgi:large subunit ribosomal protein L30